jgi:hypothetical protein
LTVSPMTVYSSLTSSAPIIPASTGPETRPTPGQRA